MSIPSQHLRLLLVGAVIALGLGVAGCGSSGPSVASLSSTSTSSSGKSTQANSPSKSPALATSGHSVSGAGSGLPAAVIYAQCLRSHGLPNYPEPKSEDNGLIVSVPLPNTDSGLSENAPQVISAARSCARQRGAIFGPPTAARVAQLQSEADAVASCMRAHGFPGQRDPVVNSMGVETDNTPKSTLNKPGYRNAFVKCNASTS